MPILLSNVTVAGAATPLLLFALRHIAVTGHATRHMLLSALRHDTPPAAMFAAGAFHDKKIIVILLLPVQCCHMAPQYGYVETTRRRFHAAA